MRIIIQLLLVFVHLIMLFENVQRSAPHSDWQRVHNEQPSTSVLLMNVSAWVITSTVDFHHSSSPVLESMRVMRATEMLPRASSKRLEDTITIVALSGNQTQLKNTPWCVSRARFSGIPFSKRGAELVPLSSHSLKRLKETLSSSGS